MTMHEFVESFLLESKKENAIGQMTSDINRLGPILPRSPVLIEHRPTHLYNTIVRRDIWY
jgi:hypothetical protein